MASSYDAETVCKQAKNAFAELANQLPMTIDSTSEMSSAIAIYLGGHCHVTFSYSLNLIKVYALMKEEFGDKLELTEDEYIELVDGDESRMEFSEYNLANVPDETLQLARTPYVNVKMIYHFWPSRIRPVVIKVE